MKFYKFVKSDMISADVKPDVKQQEIKKNW